MSPHAVTDDVDDDPDKIFKEPPREHLINTAVKFLQNPRVRPTSLAQKQKFLKQKGLTEEEIELACQKGGAYTDEQNSLSGQLRVSRAYYEKPSIWIKAKDVANLVALFSIGSYSLYSLWKSYIAPRLFGTRSRNEQNYESLLAAITKLNQNVIELKELIREMQGPPASLSALTQSRQSYEYQEIKNEIIAIKGLLLNRSQFPSSPAGIPAWQMVDTSNVEDAGVDENDGGSSRKRKNKSVKQPRGKNDSELDHSDDS